MNEETRAMPLRIGDRYRVTMDTLIELSAYGFTEGVYEIISVNDKFVCLHFTGNISHRDISIRHSDLRYLDPLDYLRPRIGERYQHDTHLRPSVPVGFGVIVEITDIVTLSGELKVELRSVNVDYPKSYIETWVDVQRYYNQVPISEEERLQRVPVIILDQLNAIDREIADYEDEIQALRDEVAELNQHHGRLRALLKQELGDDD